MLDNKVAELQRCVNQVHFKKYALENTLKKNIFEKYFLKKIHLVKIHFARDALHTHLKSEWSDCQRTARK